MRSSQRSDGIEVEVSNPNKVLFPDNEITKGELINYYERIGHTMLPHIRGRPLTLVRYPNGIAGQGFFQKRVSDYFPQWIHRFTVGKEDGTVTHPLAENGARLPTWPTRRLSRSTSGPAGFRCSTSRTSSCLTWIRLATTSRWCGPRRADSE